MDFNLFPIERFSLMNHWLRFGKVRIKNFVQNFNMQFALKFDVS